MIKSGAVFVFSVAESGIKRWTDGMLWSPSRIQGNFLVYRELSEKGYTRNSPRSSLPNDIGTIKNNGLMKKTITITHNGTDFHLISYYKKEDISCGRLQKPTTSHQIMALHLPARMFQLEKLRSPPKIEIGPDGIERIDEREEPSGDLRDITIIAGGYRDTSDSNPSSSSGMNMPRASLNGASTSFIDGARPPPLSPDNDLFPSASYNSEVLHQETVVARHPNATSPFQYPSRRLTLPSMGSEGLSLPPLSSGTSHSRHSSLSTPTPHSDGRNPPSSSFSWPPTAGHPSRTSPAPWSGPTVSRLSIGDTSNSHRSRPYHVVGQSQNHQHQSHHAHHPYSQSSRSPNSTTPAMIDSFGAVSPTPSASSFGASGYQFPNHRSTSNAQDGSSYRSDGGYSPQSQMYSPRTDTPAPSQPVMAKLEEEPNPYPLSSPHPSTTTVDYNPSSTPMPYSYSGAAGSDVSHDYGTWHSQAPMSGTPYHAYASESPTSSTTSYSNHNHNGTRLVGQSSSAESIATITSRYNTTTNPGSSSMASTNGQRPSPPTSFRSRLSGSRSMATLNEPQYPATTPYVYANRLAYARRDDGQGDFSEMVDPVQNVPPLSSGSSSADSGSLSIEGSVRGMSDVDSYYRYQGKTEESG